MKVVNIKRFTIFVIVMTLIVESIIFGLIKLTPKMIDFAMDGFYKAAYCGKYYDNYINYLNSI